ncbi:MAG TPA: ATP synthase subunit I [Gammaproteobacteria bacterium]|nr:ATP synthase subunit I [Gammaproteobacteria bacterium]
MRRLLWLQGALAAVTSAGFLAMYGIFSALCVWYGMATSAANTLLLARCARRDARAPQRTPQQSLVAAYACVVQRFLAVAVMFALGLGALKLAPLPVLAGFMAGQLVMVISGTLQLKQN